MRKANSLKGSTADKRLILLVEDDRDTREMFRACLTTGDLSCITANSVAEGLVNLRKHKIDLMVLDWALDTCGAEVLRFAREHFPALPVIVMSGLSCDVRTDALLQQADAFLSQALQCHCPHCASPTTAVAYRATVRETSCHTTKKTS